jgi:hypothetical protein
MTGPVRKAFSDQVEHDDGVEACRGARARLFHLFRTEDESGISSTGCVAEGVVFSNGWVVLVGLSKTPSMSVYPTINAVLAIHGHRGKTRIVFDAVEEERPAEAGGSARGDR